MPKTNGRELPFLIAGGGIGGLAAAYALAGTEGLTLADFARGGGEAEGTRRAARLRVEPALEPLDDGYLARFELPAGSYATVVMRELMKGEASLPEEG